MGGMGAMVGWMVIWGLVGLALLVLLTIGAVRVLRQGKGARQPVVADSPEEVLRRRYAAGELDEDDYLRRRAGLQD